MKTKKIIALSGMLLIAANSFCGLSDFTKTILNSCNDQKLPIGLAAVGLGAGIRTIITNKNNPDKNIKKRKSEVDLNNYPVNFDILRNLNNEEFSDRINNFEITVADTQRKDQFSFTEKYPGLFSEIRNRGILTVTSKLNNKDEKISGTIKFTKTEKNYYWGRIATAVTVPVIVGYVSGLVVNKLFKSA